jgi:thiol-disulfide isomerase/thioredoxin
MNTTNIIGVGLLGIVIIGAIYLAYTTSSTSNQTAVTNEDAAMAEEEMMDTADLDANEREAAAMADAAEMLDDGSSVAMTGAGSYAVYSADKLAMAESGDVVLFFKASWCPSCRALDADIKNNLDAIPAGVTILEVDYDGSQELRQKYGVTTQHTLVQVAANGELVKKWSGGNTLNAALAQVI